MRFSIYLSLTALLMLCSCVKEDYNPDSLEAQQKETLPAEELAFFNHLLGKDTVHFIDSRNMKLADKNSATKRAPDPSLYECDAKFPSSYWNTVEWGHSCSDEDDCNGNEYPIEYILEDYMDCWLGLNFPRVSTEYVCSEYQYPAQYHEGGVSEVCVGSGSTMNPWQYLDFPSNCEVTLDDVEALGDFIISYGMAWLPPPTTSHHWVLSEIDVYWTNWNECEYSQTNYNCEATENEPYPCGSIYFDDLSPCSLCKDICERRSMAIGFKAIKLCTVAENG